MPIDFAKMAEDKKAAHDAETERQKLIENEQRAAHEAKMTQAISFLKDAVYHHLDEARTSLGKMGIGLEIKEIFDRGFYGNFVPPRVTVSTTAAPRRSDGYVHKTGIIAIESDGNKVTFFSSQDSYSDPKIRKGSCPPDDVTAVVERCFSDLLEKHFKILAESPHLL